MARRPYFAFVNVWWFLIAGIATPFGMDAQEPAAGYVETLLPWSHREVFRLGGADAGPASFTRLTERTVTVDGAGSIYVLDMLTAEVTVWSDEGELLAGPFGGEGLGPGEVRSASGLFLGPAGEVIIKDNNERRLVWFSREGGYLREESFPPGMDARGHSWSLSDGVVTLSDLLTPVREGPDAGRIVVAGTLARLRRGEETWHSPEVVTVGEAILSGILSSSSCRGDQFILPAFAPVLRWHGRDSTVAFVQGDEYSITLVTGDGERTTFSHPFPRAAATRADAVRELGDVEVEWLGGPCRFDAESRAEAAGWWDVITPVLDVAVAGGNRIHVLRRDVDNPQVRRVDVFTRSGRYLGSLPPEFPWSRVWVDADRFITVETDALDLPYVVLYEIDRR